VVSPLFPRLLTRAPQNQLTIRTPEGIEFRWLLAGPFSRMCALAIDLAVIAAADSILRELLGVVRVLGEDLSAALHVVLYFALTLVYAAALEWIWRGQTVGKRLLRLRVADARGLRLEPAQVIVRNLLRAIDLLPALYFVGGAACFFGRRRQRLGDLAAGTVVVRTPAVFAPDLNHVLAEKYNSLAESRHLAARLRQRVTPEMARIGLEALMRRNGLEPAARLAIFGELAEYFRGLVPYPLELIEGVGDEQYVRNVVSVVYGASDSRLSREPVVRS